MTPPFTDHDLYLFHEGTHCRLYQQLGAHVLPDGQGTYFAVWAPHAQAVSVLCDANQWRAGVHNLQQRTGIWSGTIDTLFAGALYKFAIRSAYDHQWHEKADPFAFAAELPPRSASVVADLSYDWNDGAWMKNRRTFDAHHAPMSIYELHLGSWQRNAHTPGAWLSYRDIAPRLAAYVHDLGFTHVELLPIMEHPFYGSWGYQTTGYFAPTRRYGSPQDFMFLVDYLHQHNIGVILDWTPSHFPVDGHGLWRFDGTALFEYEDPREGFHPDWTSAIFNYGRGEVQSFLQSSAHNWCDRYHADGLRVDAVASMLYRDYSRAPDAWKPNIFGGREHLEAIQFVQRLNAGVYRDFPGVQVIAEESTAWPMVSRPVDQGGLGFGFKWDMGWMHDTLQYFRRDPIHRRHHHDELTFRSVYACTENFVLPLSHDEVVHGKGSLMQQMPGDAWQRAANLRLLIGSMMALPGKKLLFMGNEFGQWQEWSHEEALHWYLAAAMPHAGLQHWVRDCNQLYRREPALHRLDCEPAGFEWIDHQDRDQSVLAFLRHDGAGRCVLIVCNYTPEPRFNYRIGVPQAGEWRELLNSDAACYGGSNMGNLSRAATTTPGTHGREHALSLTLPPLGIVFLETRD